MKTSTLEKPKVTEIHHLTKAISTEFLKLASDFVVLPADFVNDQGLTIRDDILQLTRQSLPKELRKKLIEAGIIVDNLVYKNGGKRGIIEDDLMYLTAGIIEDNYIYAYKKLNSNPARQEGASHVVFTGAVARLIEKAKAGVIIVDNVMYRNGEHGSMVAMPVHHFAPRKSQETLFLVAIQKNGADAPKVGRLRAKFDRQGRILSLSLTNAANQSIGRVHFESIEVQTNNFRERKVTIYIDGDLFMTVNDWDLGWWIRVLGN